MITHETLSLDTSDPQLVPVAHVALEDGIDVGGRLVFARAMAAHLAAPLDELCAPHGRPTVPFARRPATTRRERGA